MDKLALLGGPKTITAPFSRYNSIGKEEADAAHAVVSSGVLSKYLGCWDPDFFGGPKVLEFERMCERQFGVKFQTAEMEELRNVGELVQLIAAKLASA